MVMVQMIDFSKEDPLFKRPVFSYTTNVSFLSINFWLNIFRFEAITVQIGFSEHIRDPTERIPLRRSSMAATLIGCLLFCYYEDMYSSLCVSKVYDIIRFSSVLSLAFRLAAGQFFFLSSQRWIKYISSLIPRELLSH